MTPRQPIVDAGRFYLREQRKSPGAPESELVDIAIRSWAWIDLHRSILRRRSSSMPVRAPRPLIGLPVAGFVDQVSSDTPVPGGGSAAALAGSLGAALAAMVANLTVGRSAHDEELSALAERAQAAKQSLADIVDDDARAFNRVMDALRMPRTTDVERHARRQMLQAAYRRRPKCHSRRRGCRSRRSNSLALRRSRGEPTRRLTPAQPRCSRVPASKAPP